MNRQFGRQAVCIAVLPFENFSDSSDDDYFSRGFTEDLITDISKISGLKVIARHSTFPYKGQGVRQGTIGAAQPAELSADVVIA